MYILHLLYVHDTHTNITLKSIKRLYFKNPTQLVKPVYRFNTHSDQINVFIIGLKPQKWRFLEIFNHHI